MGTFEFRLPDIGEGVVEGEIVGWLVKPGDAVAEDQPMVEVMTDKATVTIPSPRRGVVVETKGEVGSVARVHDVLVVIETDGAAKPGDGDGARAATPRDEAPRPREAAPPPGGAPHPREQERPAGPPLAAAGLEPEQKPLATPATRKLARDLGIDLSAVPGTGERGRVTSEDVRRQAGAAARPAQAPPRPGEAPERIPFTGLRRRIAEKMATSKRTAAHFTFVEEVDMSALVALRERAKQAAEKEGWKLTYMPFFVKAAVAGLRKHPMLNASLDEAAGQIVLKRDYNVGVAVASEAGLVVPVVKAADRLTIKQIAVEIERMAADVRAGKVQLADLQGSTFSITSLGAQGGLFATPIINFPEVAIMGIHQIKKRPVVRDGEIIVGDVMLLSLSFDHRIVDGHVGAAFAYEVIGYLEDPTRLFLEMA
ncbi:MAG: 2-oxo acid dehydrogenase subunit E2 [Deltaproteobacteria bacterium]|nr:2-oxo acid dehydrogenase subunit E2 [Deltaproteobacteria bacterium]